MSEGQRACLKLVLQHATSKEIARQLGISPHTVDQRIKGAMAKLGARTRVEAAQLCASEVQSCTETVDTAEVAETAVAQPPPTFFSTKGGVALLLAISLIGALWWVWQSANRVPFVNCAAARSAGRASIKTSEPEYALHLDSDRDGVACE